MNKHNKISILKLYNKINYLYKIITKKKLWISKKKIKDEF